MDSGRLGIATIATTSRSTPSTIPRYAEQRGAFARHIIDHQGLGFVLADIAAALDSARDLPRRRMPDSPTRVRPVSPN
ncbi:acyl-CoA dehydrogenase family protein [Nocardia sp. NPDC050630]|uniref:acyl-CoA dehydrogenase family protein n=1 Tax=Nocardia sp. NPDC050630 TaxID=3364321 RepID=UPI00378D58FB